MAIAPSITVRTNTINTAIMLGVDVANTSVFGSKIWEMNGAANIPMIIPIIAPMNPIIVPSIIN